MMLLIPKKTKYLKSFSSKKITKTKEKKSQNFQFSNYCIVADQAGILTSFQLESIRRFLRRYLKKSAQIFFRKFVSKTITKKPNDSRLGKGKGNVKYWMSILKKGEIILEVKSNSSMDISRILTKVQVKLPMKSFVLSNKTRWILYH